MNEPHKTILDALHAALDHCQPGSLLAAQIKNAIAKAKKTFKK
jgi:hypothetical protein